MKPCPATKPSFFAASVGAFAAALILAAFAGHATNAQAETGEIAAAAQIYGYNLEAGNWTMEVVPCPVMPKVSLLHYHETFPDGTESRLTVVVPVAGGRVHVVPVLHHNVTPFTPAPRNPRNYALFNQLVQGSAAKGTWLDLGACYAALTGAGSGLRSELGIAGAPRPTVHVDASGKVHRVTFATREGRSSYKVWSVSFDRFGRVTNASTESESVYAGKAPQVVPAVRNQRESAGAAEAAHPKAEAEGNAGNSRQRPSSEEAGWKYVLNPPPPPSKIIPKPPQPSEAPLPE